MAEQLRQARDLSGGREKTLFLKMGVHQSQIEGQPRWQHLSRLLFPGVEIVAAIGDRPPQSFRPDRRCASAGHRFGTNDVDDSRGSRQQGDGGGFADIARVDARSPDVSERLRIDPVAKDRVFEPVVVLEVIVRPDERAGNSGRREGGLDGDLRPEVREVRRFIDPVNGQIRDAPDARQPCAVDAHQPLVCFRRAERVQEEESVHPGEGPSNRFRFEKVALDRLDLRHTPQLRRIASQDEDLRAASDELSRDLRTDRSRAAGHEDLQSPSRLSDFDGDRTRRRPGPMPRTLAPALPRVPHDRLLPEARYLPNGAFALFHARSSMAVERTRLAGERPEAFPFTAPSLLSAFVSTHSIRWPGAGDEVKRIWGPR